MGKISIYLNPYKHPLFEIFMISLTIDAEPDLHTGDYKGITKGIPRLLNILQKHNIKATFFVTADALKKNSSFFKVLQKEGHEIALHGYKHVRFDNLSTKDKKRHILEAKKIYGKILNKKPKGFRAPQLAIDNATLEILESQGFQYDSSYAPLNLFQLIFFPTKLKLWIKSTFSPTKKYKIINNLQEIPTSSFIFPFVSLAFRMFPKPLIMVFYNIVKMFYKDQIFFAHSWDFIKLNESKIDKLCPHEKFIDRLDYFILQAIKKNKFVKMEELI